MKSLSDPFSFLAQARTFLFVPATRPDRISKAQISGADLVIVDVEDAVAAREKDAARHTLDTWLEANPAQSVVVRINATATPWHEEDLLVCRHPGVVGVMLPKAQSAADLSHVHQVTGKAVLPIIETVAGLDALAEIARTAGCCRLVFGKLDLAVELDLIPDEQDINEPVFLPYRAMLVLASRRAGLPPPVEGVFTLIHDPAALEQYARRARCHGFGGQLLIHPAQVAPVSAAFTPSSEDETWARAVLAAVADAGGGAAALNGQMIDAPVVARAERILTALGRAVNSLV